MSGKATGWVLKNYPVETQADRTRKLVFVGVADSANQYGRLAAPGIKPLCDEWGFHRATVLRALAELVETEWLTVTKPGGRGQSSLTEYAVTGMQVGSQEATLEGSPNDATLTDSHGSQESDPRVAETPDSDIAPPYRDGNDYGNDRGADAPQASLDSLGPAPKREADPLIAEAQAIAKRVWENRSPRPMTAFINVRGLVKRALEGGFPADEIERLMMKPDMVFTNSGFETAVAKSSPASERRGDEKISRIADYFNIREA